MNQRHPTNNSFVLSVLVNIPNELAVCEYTNIRQSPTQVQEYTNIRQSPAQVWEYTNIRQSPTPVQEHTNIRQSLA